MIESGFSRDIAILARGIRRGLAMKIVCEWRRRSPGSWTHFHKCLEELEVFEKVHRGGVKSAGEQKQGMSDGEGPDHAGEGFGLC